MTGLPKETSLPRWLRRKPMERLAIFLLAAGVIMLMQPLWIGFYTYSFVTELAGIVLFTIATKLPE